MTTRLRVGIVGGTGYTGVELLRLLAQHPSAKLTAITSRAEAGTRVDAMFPSLRGHVDLSFSTPDEAELDRCDVVFFATPHGVAMKQARDLIAAGVRVIDLAADFRLKDTAEFERWYGMTHTCPDLLAEAVYGLPEIHRSALAKARIVGMPGCYPTTVQLGLLPLLELHRSQPASVDLSSIVADCKSGTSGAGRKAEVGLLLSEAADNFKAYGVGGHRHHPEIVQQLRDIAGQPVGLTFVPHLVPMIRGMFSTLYVRVAAPHGSLDTVQALFERRYANEPFIDVMPLGSLPETRSVRASNMVRIALAKGHGDLVIVMVVQDNLVKGASGQAVQVMNLLTGRPETEGLALLPVVP